MAPHVEVRRLLLATVAVASALLLAGCAPGSGPIEDFPGLPVQDEQVEFLGGFRFHRQPRVAAHEVDGRRRVAEKREVFFRQADDVVVDLVEPVTISRQPVGGQRPYPQAHHPHVPDRAILTPENVQAFLEATYRRGQAVVGFSSALVRAGTLASVYSTVDEVVAQASMLVEQLANGQQPGAQYPIYWRVAVNESVARSMNIPIDDEARGFASPVR